MAETVHQEPTTPAAEGQQPERTFTQAEMNAIISDRLSRERSKYADYDDLKAKAQQFDAAQVDGVLRPLGITRNMRAYRTLSEALRLIYEQEDRLEAVQKEIYEPLADRHCCDWTAIQSMIRRAAQTAWATNPTQVQRLAGYPLTGCPSAVQFLELLYNGMVRGV